MQTFPFFRTTLVEAFIPASTANGSFIAWQKNDLLNDAICMGVIPYSSNQLSRTPKNSPVVTTLVGLSLTLIQRLPAKKVLDNFPLYSLNDSNNGGIIKEFAPFQISNTESGFNVVDGSLYTDVSAVVLVNYVNDLNEYKDAMKFLQKIYNGEIYRR